MQARSGDTEVRDAAVGVVGRFVGGEVVYTAGGRGTAGYVDDAKARRNVLAGPDGPTLALLGATWEEVRQGP